MYINPVTLSNQSTPAPGLLPLTAEQEATYLQYNGFVKLTIEDVAVQDSGNDYTVQKRITKLEPDTEAWEAWKSEQPDPLDAARAGKVQEMSAACNAAIVAGMDVETTKGTEHFSLEETDQINLTAAYNAVSSGAAGYPYHADGQLCRMFSADEITAISEASISHKLYHTTLCNHLLTWARRAETAEELAGITYTADNLPEDLAANMAAVLASASSL